MPSYTCFFSFFLIVSSASNADYKSNTLLADVTRAAVATRQGEWSAKPPGPVPFAAAAAAAGGAGDQKGREFIEFCQVLLLGGFSRLACRADSALSQGSQGRATASQVVEVERGNLPGLQHLWECLLTPSSQ